MDKILGLVSREKVILSAYIIAAVMLMVSVLMRVNIASTSQLVIISLLSFGAIALFIIIIGKPIFNYSHRRVN